MKQSVQSVRRCGVDRNFHRVSWPRFPRMHGPTVGRRCQASWRMAKHVHVTRAPHGGNPPAGGRLPRVGGAPGYNRFRHQVHDMKTTIKVGEPESSIWPIDCDDDMRYRGGGRGVTMILSSSLCRVMYDCFNFRCPNFQKGSCFGPLQRTPRPKGTPRPTRKCVPVMRPGFGPRHRTPRPQVTPRPAILLLSNKTAAGASHLDSFFFRGTVDPCGLPGGQSAERPFPQGPSALGLTAWH